MKLSDFKSANILRINHKKIVIRLSTFLPLIRFIYPKISNILYFRPPLSHDFGLLYRKAKVIMATTITSYFLLRNPHLGIKNPQKQFSGRINHLKNIS